MYRIKKQPQVGQEKDISATIWILSDIIVRELNANTIQLEELIKALKKDKERYLFIPWSQWPVPSKMLVESIERVIERRLRSSRTFRVYVVPDEIAALCAECVREDGGEEEYIYRHLIHDSMAMQSLMRKLLKDIDQIEEIFRKDNRNVSVNGIARCY